MICIISIQFIQFSGNKESNCEKSAFVLEIIKKKSTKKFKKPTSITLEASLDLWKRYLCELSSDEISNQYPSMFSLLLFKSTLTEYKSTACRWQPVPFVMASSFCKGYWYKARTVENRLLYCCHFMMLWSIIVQNCNFVTLLKMAIWCNPINELHYKNKRKWILSFLCDTTLIGQTPTPIFLQFQVILISSLTSILNALLILLPVYFTNCFLTEVNLLITINYYIHSTGGKGNVYKVRLLITY